MAAAQGLVAAQMHPMLSTLEHQDLLMPLLLLLLVVGLACAMAPASQTCNHCRVWLL
jgi:hypothetical protein